MSQDAVGRARNLGVAWFDRSGPKSAREFLVPVERLSREEVRAEIDDFLGARNLGGSRSVRSDVENAIYVPELEPLVTLVQVAQDGTVWLRRWSTRDAPDARATYFRVRPDSGVLGSLTLPPHALILASRDDLIVVRELSEFGEHLLSLYRVVGPARQ